MPEISAPEKVVAKLSDLLPKPKLNIKTYAHAANVNKQENSTARVSTAQDNISLSGLDKTTRKGSKANDNGTTRCF